MTEEVRKRVISAAILVVGFTTALVAYVASPPPESATEADLEATKPYLRAMETYGGKSNLLASDLRHWFVGLWHGRTLAFTIAVLTVVVLVAYRLAVMPLPPEDDGSDALVHGALWDLKCAWRDGLCMLRPITMRQATDSTRSEMPNGLRPPTSASPSVTSRMSSWMPPMVVDSFPTRVRTVARRRDRPC